MYATRPETRSPGGAPVALRQRGDGPGGGGAGEDPTASDPTRLESERVIVCASCGHRVTTADERVSIHGAHEHTAMNPHGLLYTIGCYREAGGCAGQGEVHHYWSWFEGYGWQIALCAGCGVHLGWRFVAPRDVFHGLIVDRLAER